MLSASLTVRVVTSNCGLLSDKAVAALTGLAGLRHTAKSLRIACVTAEMGTRECLSTSQKLPTNVRMHICIYVCICMYVCIHITQLHVSTGTLSYSGFNFTL